MANTSWIFRKYQQWGKTSCILPYQVSKVILLLPHCGALGSNFPGNCILYFLLEPHLSLLYDLYFSYRCSLGKDEIKVHFDKGGPEAYESTGIQFISEEV